MTAPFAHLYQIKDGKVIRMTQYVDTVLVTRALT
jgi:ketosteroid isomerase-like protein